MFSKKSTKAKTISPPMTLDPANYPDETDVNVFCIDGSIQLTGPAIVDSDQKACIGMSLARGILGDILDPLLPGLSQIFTSSLAFGQTRKVFSYTLNKEVLTTTYLIGGSKTVAIQHHLPRMSMTAAIHDVTLEGWAIKFSGNYNRVSSHLGLETNRILSRVVWKYIQSTEFKKAGCCLVNQTPTRVSSSGVPGAF